MRRLLAVIASATLLGIAGGVLAPDPLSGAVAIAALVLASLVITWPLYDHAEGGEVKPDHPDPEGPEHDRPHPWGSTVALTDVDPRLISVLLRAAAEWGVTGVVQTVVKMWPAHAEASVHPAGVPGREPRPSSADAPHVRMRFVYPTGYADLWEESAVRSLIGQSVPVSGDLARGGSVTAVVFAARDFDYGLEFDVRLFGSGTDREVYQRVRDALGDEVDGAFMVALAFEAKSGRRIDHATGRVFTDVILRSIGPAPATAAWPTT